MEERKPLNIVIVLAASIFCITVGLFLCSYIGGLFPVNTLDQTYIKAIVPRVLISIIFIIGMKLIYKTVVLGFGRKGFFYGLMISALMILYIIENFISGSSNRSLAEYEKVTMLNYVLCFLSTMAIGLFEEVLLRGVVFNLMNEQWKQYRFGTYAAVFGSSLLFGMAHFINYFNGSNYLNPTIAQVFYATFIGAFFASVYLKSGNLWSVIVLHALFDFAQEYWELVAPTYRNAKTDMGMGTVCYLIVFYLPLAVAAWVITNRSVHQKHIKE